MVTAEKILLVIIIEKSHFFNREPVIEKILYK